MAGEKTDYAQADLEGYDSSFEEDNDEKQEVKKKRLDLTQTKIHQQPNATQSSSAAIPDKSFFHDQQRRAEGFRNRYFALNAFERHKKLISDYFLYFPGASKLLERDSSKDKRDIDIIKEHHRFLWNDGDDTDTWEKQIAKKYYDKLYKEYTICDLSRYKENKLAMRWRVEKELLDGKGQFVCGTKRCSETGSLKTWEVNFAYMEEGVKKNALVKLRLCPECSLKLNYGQKRKEVTKTPNKRRKQSKDKIRRRKRRSDDMESETDPSRAAQDDSKEVDIETNIWKAPLTDAAELKPIEEEFDEYLGDLFV